MDSPDKIYLQITEDQEFPEDSWSSVQMAYYGWKKVMENVEYVRKDVLIRAAIEWLGEYADKYVIGFDYHDIKLHGLHKSMVAELKEYMEKL